MSSFTPENPRKVILLLHGLAERGKRIFRKLSPYLPEDSIILAPNAPFPILKTSAIGQSLGYTWYFYDTQSGKYLHNQDMARDWLKELLKKFNPEELPRSEEHTSELQSRPHLVCRLLLEKKK